MNAQSWNEEQILKLNKSKETLVQRILESLSKQPTIIFAAKLGFGVPKVDFVAVDKYRNTIGYVLRLPIVDGKINTTPYFQGLGEAFFVPDQMFDSSFLIVPEIELCDNTPFTRSPDPLYRLKNATFEAGICVFDSDYKVKVVSEAKGSLAKQFQRLKIELLDSILTFGDPIVAEDKTQAYNEWRAWAESEIKKPGGNRYMDEGTARTVVKKMLEEKNYRNINMVINETEIDSKPRPIPIFEVSGNGMYLGDEKTFYLQLSRISGVPIKRDY